MPEASNVSRRREFHTHDIRIGLACCHRLAAGTKLLQLVQKPDVTNN